MENKSYPFEYAIADLKNLLNETRNSVHSVCIFDKKNRSPFLPSYFLYMFSMFNSLYNINWEESLKSNILHFWKNDQNKHITEQFKINQIVYFCFNDNAFVDEFKVYFMEYLTEKYPKDKIINYLKEIKPDKYPVGEFYNGGKTIKFFKDNIQDLLWGNFSQGLIIDILKFIYQVRCNMFHGVKCYYDMTCGFQGERLEIYAIILDGINEMAIRYAEKMLSNLQRQK